MSVDIELSDLGSTALVTLYCRAIESSTDDPILDDPGAVDLTLKLDPVLQASDVPIHRRLVERKLDRRAVAYVAMRARRIDAYAVEFLSRHESGIVVNLGCGFDTRFARIDDGRVRFFELDRSDVIGIKRKLLPETDRCRYVEASVLDTDWLRELPFDGTPVLFLAEGLLMYLPPEGVRALIVHLRERFPGAEFVGEVFNSRWLSSWVKWMLDLKLQKVFHLGKRATFLSGLRESRDMEAWGRGIEFIDDWSALDEEEPKLGFVGSLGRFEFLRNMQRVVHYRLGS